MSEASVVTIEDGLAPTAVSKNRVGAMTHLFPRGSLVDDESLNQLRSAIDESVADGEQQLILDMVSTS